MKTVEGYRLRAIGKDHVLMPEGTGMVNYNRMIAMNQSAAFLWDKIEGKEFDTATLANLLIEEYGIDAELAQADAQKTVDAWKKAEIISD